MNTTPHTQHRNSRSHHFVHPGRDLQFKSAHRNSSIAINVSVLDSLHHPDLPLRWSVDLMPQSLMHRHQEEIKCRRRPIFCIGWWLRTLFCPHVPPPEFSYRWVPLYSKMPNSNSLTNSSPISTMLICPPYLKFGFFLPGWIKREAQGHHWKLQNQTVAVFCMCVRCVCFCHKGLYSENIGQNWEVNKGQVDFMPLGKDTSPSTSCAEVLNEN